MNLPEQYKDKMKKLLADEYEDYIHSFDEHRRYGLRANTLKINPHLLSTLLQLEHSPVRWCEEGMYFSEEDRPSKSVFYRAGLFYLQEPSAMSAASVLDVRPGDHVLDICAAPGGKTTQMGAALCNSGILFANDASASRAKALLRNIEIFGISNSVITIETPERLSKKLPQYFNKILVDAPCSGEGMFRKTPDAIKAWSEDKPTQLIPIQRSILTHAAQMLAPDGHMLYSTCTFDPEENEGNIIWFLENHPNFELLPIPCHDSYGFDNGLSVYYNVLRDVKYCARLLPHKINGEGHFLALLHKKYSLPSEQLMDACPTDAVHNKHKPKSSTAHKLAPKFYNSMSSLEYYYAFVQKYMCWDTNQNLHFHGDSLYCLPEAVPDLSGLRIMRSGLHLGEVKKNRFEPSHALALALKKSDVKSAIDFTRDDENLMRYLRGESFLTDAVDADGWCLVCVEGYPLGWGKILDGRLKNKYPVGWKLE